VNPDRDISLTHTLLQPLNNGLRETSIKSSENDLLNTIEVYDRPRLLIPDYSILKSFANYSQHLKSRLGIPYRGLQSNSEVTSLPIVMKVALHLKH